MIKYLIMDVDGTLTDGKIYMGPNGEAMKAFSIKDGYVVNYILKPAGIKPVIITARTSSIVQNRCKELGITEVYQGKTDKQRTLMDIVGDNNLSHCAYSVLGFDAGGKKIVDSGWQTGKTYTLGKDVTSYRLLFSYSDNRSLSSADTLVFEKCLSIIPASARDDWELPIM